VHVNQEREAAAPGRTVFRVARIATRSADQSSSIIAIDPGLGASSAGGGESNTGGPGPGQALAMSLPGIGSASAVRHSGAPKAFAKYCVSCTTFGWANSIMLTE